MTGRRDLDAPRWTIRSAPALGRELGLLAGALVAQAGALAALRRGLEPQRLWFLLQVLATLGSLAGVFGLLRRFRQAPAWLEIRSHGFRVGWGETVGLVLPDAEVYSVELRQEWPRLVQIGRVGRLPINVPISHFASPAAAEAFVTAAQAHLAKHAGAEVLARRAEIGRRVLSGTPVVTATIATLLAGVFAAEWAVGAPGDTPRLTALGAVLGTAIQAGEWHRIFTGALLHGSVAHLALNAANLLFCGAVLERVLGGARLVVVVGVSSVAGILCRALIFPEAPAVGASAGVFGLLGVIVALPTLRAEELPCTLRLSWGTRSFVVFGFLLADLISRGFASEAHVAGLVAGAGLVPVLIPRSSLERLPSRTSRTLRVAAGVIAASYLAAAVWIGVAATRL